MKHLNQKLNYLFSLLLLVALSFSCSSDDDVKVTPPTFTVDTPALVTFKVGESKNFASLNTNVKNIEVTNLPGWTVEINKTDIVITAPKQHEKNNIYTGQITLKAIPEDQTQQAITVNIDVNVVHTITFEDVAKDFLAGPTSYGDNLYPHYSGSTPPKYTGYVDKATGLTFNMTTTGYGFASGGIAISQWNNKEKAGHTNQASVYSGDHNQNNGGNNNSSTFAFAFAPTFGNSGAFMQFDKEEEHIIDHAYFTNNTYAVLSMMNGDGFAKAHTYEKKSWFKLAVIGIDKDGKETGSVEVSLSDFTQPTSPGILKKWVKADLKSLGKVNKVIFKMSSSDGEGSWMNTPAYFCIDDLTINL